MSATSERPRTSTPAAVAASAATAPAVAPALPSLTPRAAPAAAPPAAPFQASRLPPLRSSTAQSTEAKTAPTRAKVTAVAEAARPDFVWW